MNRTLIVYGTRKGTTKETVQLIAQVLKDYFSYEVDISGTKEMKYYRKRIDDYDNIIIGSSIMSGRWKSKILSFARLDLFGSKQVALFVTAGGTLNKVNKFGITKEDAINEATEKYIDKSINKFKFVPVSKTAFGGRVIKKNITKYDSWNREDVVSWAIALGEKLKK
jgi:menaquinone-dependent protoporphyrinogen IX oxidase